jgi:hypothetical protein
MVPFISETVSNLVSAAGAARRNEIVRDPESQPPLLFDNARQLPKFALYAGLGSLYIMYTLCHVILGSLKIHIWP